jgi:outer membrane protein OmpA-like peptidoglycan-associated protein
MNSSWKVDQHQSLSGDNYWASYSDLMAGILLVFAIAAAASWIHFQNEIIEPTEPLRRWAGFAKALCEDEVLKEDRSVDVNCNTGSLIITESSLRYPRSGTELSEEGKRVLDRIVPRYLSVVTEHLTQYFTEEDILEGIEVGGHTDSTGDYGSNSWVSRERAGNVLLYLMDSVSLEDYHGLLQEKGYTVGYADSRLPTDRTDADIPEARRIELKVHLNDSKILEQIMELINSISGS